MFDDLNPMQTLFVYEYLKDFNAGLAAYRAGYSPKTCQQQGNALCKNSTVRLCIDYMIAERCKALQIDHTWVLQEYLRMYEAANLANYTTVDDGGRITYDFSGATKEQIAMLDGLSIKPSEWGTQYKVTMPSREKLLLQIGKHVNVQAWKDQVQLTGAISVSFDRDDADC